MKLLRCLSVVAALSLATLTGWTQEAAKPYRVDGQWIEACSCGIPCGCAISGKAESGCQGVSVFSVRSGKYGDVDLAGARLATALQPGDWAILYFDPQTTPAQRDALRAILAPDIQALGVKIEATREAPITLSGTDGRFTIQVGDAISLRTEPVMGLDKTRPIEYRNVPFRLIRQSYQGRAVSGTYKDGGHEFTLQDSNAFWSNVRLRQ